MTSHFWLLLAYGQALMLLWMTVVWCLARRINNFSIVDIAWCFGFTVLNSFFYMASPGWPPRRLLILSMVALWSVRLGAFLTRRIARHHPIEDGRYKTLRQQYGSHVNLRFFLFFQAQGISIVALSLPFLFLFQNDSPSFHVLEIIGAFAWLLCWLGESLADYQMSRFKSNPNNRGKTCQAGLWKYSRHPNYFFEICIWFCFYLTALSTSGAWVTIYCPLFMLFLIVFVTGVPPAEAQAVHSRGEEYKDYQQRTSMLIPWFPGRGKK